MIEQKMRSNRGPPPKRPESDEEFERHEEHTDGDYLIFIKWASNLYHKLCSGIPKSYIIERGRILQNPEHVTWREDLKSLRSNLERRIRADKSPGLDANIRAASCPDLYELYDKVLELGRL